MTNRILLFVITITLFIIYFIGSTFSKFQPGNNKDHRVFNNDYIPPKSPLDSPQRMKPYRAKAITEADHRDEINGRNIIHREVPEKGFVVLNGIKRRIYDCKDL